jgi:rhamnosyltransferase
MISIVIPTKNGGELFEHVLQGLADQSYRGERELVIVDSGSTDRTLSIAHRHRARIHETPPHEFNHGETRNYGVRVSEGEVVVLMTQDAVPANASLLDNLVAPFSDGEVAGVMARQIPRPQARAITRRNLNAWVTGQDVGQVKRIADPAQYERLSPMERYMLCTFDNVCSAVRKSTWHRLPFPKTYFGEDIEWGKRALMNGWKTVYEPRAVVVHSHDRTLNYEYKRTYLCHRRLYELFQLQTVPTLRHVLRGAYRGSVSDLVYTLKHDSIRADTLLDLLSIPLLTAASVWGQYAGARDERMGRPNRVKGV